MICSQCAAEMPEISVFCPGCGRAVESASNAEPAPPAATAEDTRETLLGASAYFALVPAALYLAIPAVRAHWFVRFHSWQSILFTVASAAAIALLKLLFAILSIIPVIGFLFAWLSLGLVSMAIVIAWVVLIVKAIQGQSYELPWIGPWAARLAN